MITAENIRELFSDLLSLINDEDLRGKVVDAWVEGCRQGGWESMDQLENMPFTLLTDTKGINNCIDGLLICPGNRLDENGGQFLKGILHVDFEGFRRRTFSGCA